MIYARSLIALAYILVRQQRRRRDLAREIARVKQRMAARRKMAIARLLLLIAAQESGPRRHVERCIGKWRGSTIGIYLHRGDAQTFYENFRMPKATFDVLDSLLAGSDFALGTAPAGQSATCKGKQRKWTFQAAHAKLDPPSTRFKLAVCLYAMGQGGRFKQIGDAAGVSKNTVRKWMVAFCEAVMQVVRPVYMPAQPFSTSEREAVQSQFASRRGIPSVTLACDGSHVPFFPRCGKKHKMEYRNYKGWTSILAVAFVDSYHRFFDLQVGSPGRAGDNTVLGKWGLVSKILADPDTWLGPNGVVLGDSGASDGDSVFLNPYHAAADADKCWFNFCHSSTRFFVEEAFGRWKNKWRFLLDPCRVNHKLTSQMIYTSAVLHNFCIAHSTPDAGRTERGTHVWTTHFATMDQRCPMCKRRNVGHCVHQGLYRAKPSVIAARKQPSQVREDLCSKLWEWVGNGASLMPHEGEEENEQLQQIRSVMQGRAQKVTDVYCMPVAA